MDEPRSGFQLVDQISGQLIPRGAVGIWWLGQASLVLKAGDLIVYVDPYLTPDERRLSPPPFAAEAAVNADLVFLTHDHIDHLDRRALSLLSVASPQARFIAPRPLAEQVAVLVGKADRVVPAVAAEGVTLGPVEFVPVPAKHEEFDRDPELGFPHLGYVLKLAGATLYVAGDTVPYEGLIETLTPFAIDLAFLPINGRDFFRSRRGTVGNMDYREAADLAVAIGVDTVAWFEQYVQGA